MSLSRFVFFFFKKEAAYIGLLSTIFVLLSWCYLVFLLFGWTTKVWFDGLIFKTIVQSLI